MPGRSGVSLTKAIKRERDGEELPSNDVVGPEQMMEFTTPAKLRRLRSKTLVEDTLSYSKASAVEENLRAEANAVTSKHEPVSSFGGTPPAKENPHTDTRSESRRFKSEQESFPEIKPEVKFEMKSEKESEIKFQSQQYEVADAKLVTDATGFDKVEMKTKVKYESKSESVQLGPGPVKLESGNLKFEEMDTEAEVKYESKSESVQFGPGAVKLEFSNLKFEGMDMKAEVKCETNIDRIQHEPGAVKAESSNVKSEVMDMNAEVSIEEEPRIIPSRPNHGPSLVERIPLWRKQCLEFQRLKRTWHPLMPCCLANFWLYETKPSVACVDLLGRNALIRMLKFIQRGEVLPHMTTPRLERLWRSLVNPTLRTKCYNEEEKEKEYLRYFFDFPKECWHQAGWVTFLEGVRHLDGLGENHFVDRTISSEVMALEVPAITASIHIAQPEKKLPVVPVVDLSSEPKIQPHDDVPMPGVSFNKNKRCWTLLYRSVGEKKRRGKHFYLRVSLDNATSEAEEKAAQLKLANSFAAHMYDMGYAQKPKVREKRPDDVPGLTWISTLKSWRINTLFKRCSIITPCRRALSMSFEDVEAARQLAIRDYYEIVLPQKESGRTHTEKSVTKV